MYFSFFFFQLYWDIQLLNAGMQATPVDTAKSFSSHSPAQDCVCDTPELNACEKAHKTSLDLGCRDKLEVGARSEATINQRLLALSIRVLFTHR